MTREQIIQHLQGCRKLGRKTTTVDVEGLLAVLQDIPANKPQRQSSPKKQKLDLDGGNFDN